MCKQESGNGQLETVALASLQALALMQQAACRDAEPPQLADGSGWGESCAEVHAEALRWVLGVPSQVGFKPRTPQLPVHCSIAELWRVRHGQQAVVPHRWHAALQSAAAGNWSTSTLSAASADSARSVQPDRQTSRIGCRQQADITTWQDAQICTCLQGTVCSWRLGVCSAAGGAGGGHPVPAVADAAGGGLAGRPGAGGSCRW